MRKKRKQTNIVAFYATQEVKAILSTLPDGTRSAYINAAILAAAQGESKGEGK